jgi:ligand-binding sensor domain-containing protein
VHFGTGEGLPSASVWKLMLDSQGSLWLTTEGGVAKISAGTVTRFDLSTGFPHRLTRSLAEVNGEIWVGMWGHGLYRQEGDAWTRVVPESTMVSEKVQTIALDDTSAWVATPRGVSQIDLATGEMRHYVDETQEANPDSLYAIFPVGHQNLSDLVIATSPELHGVWFASLDSSLMWYQPGDTIVTVFTPENSGMPAWGIADLTVDPSGRVLWVAFVEDGVASFDPSTGTWTHYTIRDGLPTEYVTSITFTTDGRLWVGTTLGIAYFDGQRFHAFDRDNGLPDDVVRVVYGAPDGTLWVGFALRGVARIDKVPGL